MMHKDLINAYQASDLPSILLGAIMVDGAVLPHAPVHLLLKQLNRHGLVAGATGSGKTKTLQVLAEQLSLSGIPSLMMDIKGDLSGLALPGTPDAHIQKRAEILDIPYQAQAFPVELLSLSPNIAGTPVRASIADFGPLLFSRLLGLNDTQSAVVTILFEFAKNNELLLLDLVDFKELLRFSQSPQGRLKIEKEYGLVVASSVSTIMRQIIGLESQGGDYFFGEPALNVLDLMKQVGDKGVISILRVMDMQDRPNLFSTLMIKLLADLYRQLPECGDLDKPKLVLFIDEAHLVFHHASKALLTLMDTIVKLIRSKGVGLIFCTQTPKDIPENILSQLGFKIQHVLRAFTAKDRQMMNLTAQNFPLSDVYDTKNLLTDLGIGEALLTAIDAKGSPTPLVQCMIRTPTSHMGALDEAQERSIMNQSDLYLKYAEPIDRKSAREILEVNASPPPQVKAVEQQSFYEILSKNPIIKQVTRDVVRKLTQMALSFLKTRK